MQQDQNQYQQGGMPPQAYGQQDYFGQQQFEAEEPFPLLDYLQLLWFRRRLIIAVTLFVAIIGFIHVNQLVNVYTASSTLMINVPETNVVDIDQVVTRQSRFGNLPAGESEVLQSRGLAAKVINKLNLLSYEEFNPSLHVPEESFWDFLQYLNPKTWIPDSWKKAIREAISGEVKVIVPTEEEAADTTMARAVDIFLGKLNIGMEQWSNIITIQVNSLSPKLAARIANELPESYILDQLQSKFDATEKATEWLTEKLSGLETQVAESERAVEFYREEHGLTKGAGSGIMAEQLSEINSQLIVSRAERAAAEARLLQINRLIGVNDQYIFTLFGHDDCQAQHQR